MSTKRATLPISYRKEKSLDTSRCVECDDSHRYEITSFNLVKKYAYGRQNTGVIGQSDEDNGDLVGGDGIYSAVSI
jgi:hypothetical protein